ncbi:class A beta-lactamase, subclass A2 [Mucilaginibacter sp. HMF5004]|uniref:class A beta-lactamase, subclass A2 n=1 Tax=Mucilaginibacter rivuli TaxID=2857527 RepID=UPI001C5DF84E|nr:class A beta-lactamase, subclass A2 [Mucilaginibacter rivuli]MBW4891562.1 class A beta-lactamase, subclass A2 [Mucilaginibacter rivuli]
MYKSFLLFVISISIALSVRAQSKSDSLRLRVQDIAKQANGTVGFAMMVLEGQDTLSYNGNLHLPMQSVMKFPIAITVLNAVDDGRLKLDSLIHISKSDLPETYSPLRDKFPEGNVDVSVKELLSYMVSLSDNDACDILLKVLGGTDVVDDYMHSFGISKIAVKATEYQMAQAWDVQFTNWTTAKEMIRLLDIAMKPNFLSKTSHAYLWQIMQATSTGPNQIKGLLPAGTMVAHKTGRSSTNDKGIAAATNDVGVITLPNGKHLAIAIFVNNSSADLVTRESVIAWISKEVYDYEAAK